jgi:nucleoside-diphosphate-sugar epimerase|tara:strand:- start:3022 stop:3939 length:918 start_codon:yes stop_codon:yes gene_type:complete
MTKNLLIVGGTGFVGSYLAKKSINCGYSTSVISLNPSKKEKKIKQVNYISADVSNFYNLKESLPNQIDYVVNLSGYVDHSSFLKGGNEVIHTHFGGLMNLLTLLDRKSLKRFIQIGSSDEYGNNAAPQREVMQSHPISPYSFSKSASNELLQMLSRTESFPVVMLRFFLVYGPGQDNQRFLPQIIQGCLSGTTFPVSEGRQIRDFCYVDDIADGIISSLEANSIEGELINLASGKAKTIRSVIEFINEYIGNGKPEYGKVPYRPDENMELFADINKANKLLNWQPKTSFEEGITQTIDYYRRLGK